MPNNLLKVPHLSQPYDALCLPACAAMILAYWGEPTTPVTIEHLANLFDTMELIGTPASRILRLQKWGWAVTYREGNIDSLRELTTRKIPPIVMVRTGFLDYWDANVFHAAVVVGIDEQAVYLNDPEFESAPQACAIDTFIAAWIEHEQMVATITRAK